MYATQPSLPGIATGPGQDSPRSFFGVVRNLFSLLEIAYRMQTLARDGQPGDRVSAAFRNELRAANLL